MDEVSGVCFYQTVIVNVCLFSVMAFNKPCVPSNAPFLFKNKIIFNNIGKQNLPTLKMAKVQQLKCLFLALKFLCFG